MNNTDSESSGREPASTHGLNLSLDLTWAVAVGKAGRVEKALVTPVCSGVGVRGWEMN